MKTDSQWLLDFLKDGQWHALNEIIRASMQQRGHALTVHSRAAELRGKGHEIIWRYRPGRGQGQYRLFIPA